MSAWWAGTDERAHNRNERIEPHSTLARSALEGAGTRHAFDARRERGSAFKHCAAVALERWPSPSPCALHSTVGDGLSLLCACSRACAAWGTVGGEV